jgi:hypothetical protein
MFQLPEIPFNELHSFLVSGAGIVLAVNFLCRLIRSEVCRRRCELCGEPSTS